MLWTINMTLSRALVFAGDLIHGDWHEVRLFDEPAVMRNTHILECQTTKAVISICTITGKVETFEFTHKEEN